MTNSNSDATEADDLGPLLYEEHRHITPAVIYTSLGSVFLIVGVLCSFIPVPPPGPPHGMLIMGLIVAAGGALCLVIGLVRLIPNIGASWHLHEHGVKLISRNKEQILRYEDVDELTVNVVRVFFHNVCTADVYDATFKSHEPLKKTVFIKQIRRPTTASGVDLNRPGELEQVCDRIAGLIADRMLAKMERGKPVAWVGAVSFHSDGIEIDSSGTVPERIEWSDIENIGMDQGVLQLSRRGNTRPIVKLKTKLPNFFPGYRVLLDRIGPGVDAETKDG